jgi:hypothetical protein
MKAMSTTPIPTPTTLDQALNNVTAAEATYNADQATVVNIQTAISTASAPLPSAQAAVATDVANLIAALQAADTIIQQKITALQGSTGGSSSSSGS